MDTTDAPRRRRDLLSSAAIDLLERIANEKAHWDDPGWDSEAWRELRAQGLVYEPAPPPGDFVGLTYGQRQGLKRRGHTTLPRPRVWPRLTNGGRRRLAAIRKGRARAGREA